MEWRKDVAIVTIFGFMRTGELQLAGTNLPFLHIIFNIYKKIAIYLEIRNYILKW